ncbi:MAG: OB-fold domain-containing protein [Pseudopelagicola sp.]|nr:OB-fold domain-containing protein [Pseudopelagicola sp.]
MPDATGPDQIYDCALASKEILLPKCDDCGAYHFFPRVLCPHCHGTSISWMRASGKGRVHTTTVVRRKPERGGDYNVCMVELEEGVRMMSRVDGIAPGDVAIDMAVTAFVDDAEGTPIVLFRPAEV